MNMHKATRGPATLALERLRLQSPQPSPNVSKDNVFDLELLEYATLAAAPDASTEEPFPEISWTDNGYEPETSNCISGQHGVEYFSQGIKRTRRERDGRLVRSKSIMSLTSFGDPEHFKNGNDSSASVVWGRRLVRGAVSA
jgi:hypothetical protein